jgi:exosome complex RNA-binding protein Rrp42 (RNase PH superfamily)
VLALAKESSNSDDKDADKPALQVDADIAAALCIPGVDQSPVIVTVTILKCQASKKSSSSSMTMIMILDATKQEEACAFAQVHVSVDSIGTICAVQKAGGGSLPLPLLQDICQFAIASVTTNITDNTNKASHGVSSQTNNTNTNYQYLLQEQFSIQQ